MKFSSQILEICRGSKVAVERIDIRLPIAMVCTPIAGVASKLGSDWRYPYGIEAHSLDVIELVDDPLPRAATIQTNRSITSQGRGAIGKCKTICHDLIDRSAAP